MQWKKFLLINLPSLPPNLYQEIGKRKQPAVIDTAGLFLAD
jgi:hypothetical protein